MRSSSILLIFALGGSAIAVFGHHYGWATFLAGMFLVELKDELVEDLKEKKI
jgi:hypothetical protein